MHTPASCLVLYNPFNALYLTKPGLESKTHLIPRSRSEGGARHYGSPQFGSFGPHGWSSGLPCGSSAASVSRLPSGGTPSRGGGPLTFA